ncbi:divergent AAA domain protein (macronuclear) [Tetrahymena thermophila SB210]|uniref:Divergent AAA domain protein n=1 Tax=Tetrahymena thermophila (strain SB210) TaxID=312017 RepID=Q23J89_TETTS|nr:divergent AAA domain protein [Tetrahymena thermophila SB210]EAR96615.2 divergent AAA domain protein [Tetrahymena thermophila SB210]|eukprot:XP_001016860.2 divergent AAA domain protein [Tetrahymena thermophila SB210]
MSQAQQLELVEDEEIDIIQDDQLQIQSRSQQVVIKNEREFDWVRYKTEECCDKECALLDKKKEFVFPLLFNCIKWHNQFDKRRKIVVKDKNKFNYSRLFVKETDREDTRFCMNFFEYFYHPQNFRSKECPSVAANQNLNGTTENSNQLAKDKPSVCIYGIFCPYYHNQAEKNDWVNDLKATKYMAAPKEKFTQSLLDDFNNIQSSNKQLEKLYEQISQQKVVPKNQNTNSNNNNSVDQVTPISKNEPSPKEKLNMQLANIDKIQDNKMTQNTANILLDLYDDDSIVDRNDILMLDPINELEEKHTNSKGSDSNLQGRTSKVDKSNKKISYSPKSKTMVNLEQKETKKKTQNPPNKNDQNTPVNQEFKNQGDLSNKNIDIQVAELKIKQEQNQNKKSKKNNEYQFQDIRHSSNSLNNPDTKSKSELDITKQTSKYTDLSSNDEYLKDFTDVNTQKYSNKVYYYKQDLGHESSTVEFKNYQKISSCKIQKDMIAILKLQEYGQYICGFLNHKGGTMYIGVHDEGWVDGISLNAKQKDWFNLYIDYITSLIEPRLVVGEVRINYTEVIGKPVQLSKDCKNYVIELQVVKTNYSDIYFFENNAYIKKQSSNAKMSIQEIKQDLQVKIKKQLRAECNQIQKMFLYDDLSDLDSQNLKQLQKLEEKLKYVLNQVQIKIEEKKQEN